jgi:hypothetical protein
LLSLIAGEDINNDQPPPAATAEDDDDDGSSSIYSTSATFPSVLLAAAACGQYKIKTTTRSLNDSDSDSDSNSDSSSSSSITASPSSSSSSSPLLLYEACLSSLSYLYFLSLPSTQVCRVNGNNEIKPRHDNIGTETRPGLRQLSVTLYTYPSSTHIVNAFDKIMGTHLARDLTVKTPSSSPSSSSSSSLALTPLLPLCDSVSSLLLSLKYGERVSTSPSFDISSPEFDSFISLSAFQPYQCQYKWFRSDELCDLLSEFNEVILVGDSLTRHHMQAIFVLLSDDLKSGMIMIIIISIIIMIMTTSFISTCLVIFRLMLDLCVYVSICINH